MSLALLGGGGHASDVLAVVEDLARAGAFEGEVWVADDAWHQPERFEGRMVAGLLESIEEGARRAPFVVAVGYPAGRRAVFHRAADGGGQSAPPLTHPMATIGHAVELGDGVVVFGQTWVSPRVRIGQHSHVSYGATIGHDTVIGEFCSVMPGACVGGDVVVGNGVLVGANATVLQGLTIGDGATIGAGATVTRGVAAGVTVVGSPARPIS